MRDQSGRVDPIALDEFEPLADRVVEEIASANVGVDHVDRLPIPHLEVNRSATALMETEHRDHSVLAHQRGRHVEPGLNAARFDHDIERPSPTLDRCILRGERRVCAKLQGYRSRVGPWIDCDDLADQTDAQQFEHQQAHVADADDGNDVSCADGRPPARFDHAAEGFPQGVVAFHPSRNDDRIRLINDHVVGKGRTEPAGHHIAGGQRSHGRTDLLDDADRLVPHGHRVLGEWALPRMQLAGAYTARDYPDQYLSGSRGLDLLAGHLGPSWRDRSRDPTQRHIRRLPLRCSIYGRVSPGTVRERRS